jgi:predicted metalloendopeptidase
MAAGPARKAADEILALETRLSEASLAPAAAADPVATAHKSTFAQLSRLAPRFDWEGYFAEAGLPRIDVNVAEPAFVERLNRELEATPVTVWKAYLTWHLLESAAPWLSKPFADESLRLQGQTPRRRDRGEAPSDALSRIDGDIARRAARPRVRRTVLFSRGEGQGPGDGS